MVSTDHDFHLDYAPVIAALNLEPFVTSIVGVEVTGSVPNPPAFPQLDRAHQLLADDGRRDGAPRRLHRRRVRGAEHDLQAAPRRGRRRGPVQPPARRDERPHLDRLLQQHGLRPLRERHRPDLQRRRRLPGRARGHAELHLRRLPAGPRHHRGAERRAALRRRHGQRLRAGREPRRHPQHRLRRDGDRERHQPERLPAAARRLVLAARPGERADAERAGADHLGDRRLRLPPHQHRGGRLHAHLRVRERRRPHGARRDGVRREHPRRAHDGHDGSLHRDDPRGRGRDTRPGSARSSTRRLRPSRSRCGSRPATGSRWRRCAWS